MPNLSHSSDHTRFVGKFPSSPSILAKEMALPYADILSILQEMKADGTVDTFEISLLGRKEFVYFLKN